MFALNCTELPGAAIDACGAGISLRGISVAAGIDVYKRQPAAWEDYFKLEGHMELA